MERLNLKWVFVSSVCALLVIPLLLFYVEYSFNSFRFYTNHTPYLSVYELPVVVSLVCFAVLAPIFARVKPKLLILPVALVMVSQTVFWFLTRSPHTNSRGEISFINDFYVSCYILLFIMFIFSVIDAKSVARLFVISVFFIILSIGQKTVEIITILAMGTHTVLVQPMTEGYPTEVQMYDDISLDEMLKMILFSLSMLFLALSLLKPGQRRPDLAE